MKFEDLHVNDNAYYINTVTDTIQRCTIKELHNRENIKFAKIRDTDLGGTINVKTENIFLTEKDAKDEMQKRNQAELQAYKAEIQSVDDLVNFMFNHHVACGDYTDWNARLAANIRAKELGIKIKE